jgi:DNA-binding CsgD family transcriptional regulator
VKVSEEDYLAHYGIQRRSGRYPWGSGQNPNQRSRTFLDIIDKHKSEGLSEAKIAELYSPSKEKDPTGRYKLTSTDIRAMRSQSVNIQTQESIREAMRLREKGMSPSEIGRQMGKNESTIRSYLEPGRLEKLDILQETANMLKKEVAEKQYIDVGAQVERALPIGDNPEVRIGISKDKFNTAIAMLKEEGYSVHNLNIPQVGTGEFTKYRVLSKEPQTKEGQKQVFLNRDKIQVITKKSDDGGRTFNDDLAIVPPLHIDPKRVQVRYKEDGGADHDGVIYVRPGVKDISLGKSRYAQVRIAIKGDHYLKGMAIYKDDLPDGVDLQFNTNKSNTGNKFDAMKPMKTDKDGNIDPKNPFGAVIKVGGQIKDKDTGKVTSAMNLINEEGDWHTWSRTLSRQVLAKQSTELVKQQLDLTYEKRRQEYEEIKALTNPTIKRKLLESFSDETDSAAVHLKAAAMPAQATKVILPITSMKPKEIYAPTFENGQRVVLVRFPHAGTFELPELTVNNKNREAIKLLGKGEIGKAHDVVGIHPKVAEHLSGADFDGDHVVVIPNNRGQITTKHPLDGLKNFDPQEKYKVPLGPKSPEHPKGKPIITSDRKEQEMGKVTNLIADMTVKGASMEDVAAAVRHSMVVIDSEKHNLDYKASERDNKILALKHRYQGTHEKTGQPRGAATLITRATARIDVPKRKLSLKAEGGPLDLKTGEKRYTPTGERNKRGDIKTFRSKRLAETTDAFTLVSDNRGTEVERTYAAHSNKLKALANEARLETHFNTKPIKMSQSAKQIYAPEVAQLNSKLNAALKNAPLERQAQVVANTILSQRRRANPDMDASEKKKIKGLALDEARVRTGAKKARIEITDREWDAIQAGAISNSKLKDILTNTDVDKLKERATPKRKNPVMTPALMLRAKAMMNSGYTLAEIADHLGIAPSTLQSSVGGGGE